MSDRRNTSTALKMRLSILFRNAHDLELRLVELNELRDQVSRAELLARKSRRAGGSGPARLYAAIGKRVAAHIGG